MTKLLFINKTPLKCILVALLFISITFSSDANKDSSSDITFSIGLDLIRYTKVKNHPEGILGPYFHDLNHPTISFGIQKNGILGKKKNIDLCFEYSAGFPDKDYYINEWQSDNEQVNIELSLIEIYNRWRFYNDDAISLFLKLGIFDFISLNINGEVLGANPEPLFGLGVISKIGKLDMVHSASALCATVGDLPSLGNSIVPPLKYDYFVLWTYRYNISFLF